MGLEVAVTVAIGHLKTLLMVSTSLINGIGCDSSSGNGAFEDIAVIRRDSVKRKDMA